MHRANSLISGDPRRFVMILGQLVSYEDQGVGGKTFNGNCGGRALCLRETLVCIGIIFWCLIRFVWRCSAYMAQLSYVAVTRSSWYKDECSLAYISMLDNSKVVFNSRKLQNIGYYGKMSRKWENLPYKNNHTYMRRATSGSNGDNTIAHLQQ
ncbi:hypothetical protein B0H34DRAFT_379693 [Crassisporium funariophilum]|nr:hypothetical protein B0H34DRAFT_379693 [Crassisporium funariophilum]